MLKRNNFSLGLILGLFMPSLGVLLFYIWKFYPSFSFTEYIEALRNNRSLVSALTIPCLVVNIAIFTLYINTNKYETAKGIFIITIMYAVLALITKFLLP